MRNRITLIWLVLVFAKEKKAPPTSEELAAITSRGRALYDYERAVWNARAALKSINPPADRTGMIIGRKAPDGWLAGIGTLNEKKDAFLLFYEVAGSGSDGKLSVRTIDPPKPETDFYLAAANAIDSAKADFREQSRPYNVSVLPAATSQLYVYLYPAVTKPGVIPLGGDVRYRIAEDGKKIIERRDLHKSILELTNEGVPAGATVAGGYHTHVLTDVPEDTDILYVFHRHLPETVGAGGRIFMVAQDGTIKMVGK